MAESKPIAVAERESHFEGNYLERPTEISHPTNGSTMYFTGLTLVFTNRHLGSEEVPRQRCGHAGD